MNRWLDLRHVAGSLVAATALATVAVVAAGSEAGPSYPLADWLQRAEAIQRCLDEDVLALQVQSSTGSNGQALELLQVTHWEASGTTDVRTAAPRRGCNTSHGSVAAPCLQRHGVMQNIPLQIIVDEVHASWSANERARLEDGVADTLTNLGDGVHIVDPRMPGYGQLDATSSSRILRARVTYTGSALSQRELDDWLRLPRSVVIRLDLVDSAAQGRIVAARRITARAGLGFRGRFASDAPPAWRDKALEAVATAAREVLATVACSEPSLQVTVSSGKLWLDTAGFTGLVADQPLLLVPAAETAGTGIWPIAVIRSASGSRSEELELVLGSTNACATGCRAVPL